MQEKQLQQLNAKNSGELPKGWKEFVSYKSGNIIAFMDKGAVETRTEQTMLVSLVQKSK